MKRVFLIGLVGLGVLLLGREGWRLFRWKACANRRGQRHAREAFDEGSQT